MQTRGPIGKCPVCQSDLRITKFSCPSCRTEIVTDLPTCEFCKLDAELLKFLRVFLAARGNIKEVERELGISYPTVRKRLDDLLSSLALAGGVAPQSEQRLEVLERLRNGEIGVEDALHLLGGEAKGSEIKG